MTDLWMNTYHYKRLCRLLTSIHLLLTAYLYVRLRCEKLVLFFLSSLSRGSCLVFSGRWNDKTKISEQIYLRPTLTNVKLVALETSMHSTTAIF